MCVWESLGRWGVLMLEIGDRPAVSDDLTDVADSSDSTGSGNVLGQRNCHFGSKLNLNIRVRITQAGSIEVVTCTGQR